MPNKKYCAHLAYERAQKKKRKESEQQERIVANRVVTSPFIESLKNAKKEK
tara:strand:- start:1233 stop:1385 length:153 start_codon:yes stop_codon:yes gene_type:complete